MKRYLFPLLLLLIASCKRDTSEPQPYSSWTIGTDSFSTNQTDVSSSKAGLSLLSKTSNSSYYYGTIRHNLPNDGTWSLNVSNTNNPDYLDVLFSRDTVGYEPFDSTSSMQVSRSGGIVTMELPLTRFINFKRPTDTQWIKAIIRVRE